MSQSLRNSDGSIRLQNQHLSDGSELDILYHLALDTKTHDLPKMFGDVKFVCMGGSAVRAKAFAEYIKDVLNFELPTGAAITDITAKSHRYAMYKVGPVLSVSHGIGVSSMSVLMLEVIKLMSYAKAKDPIFIRTGTSGGLGVRPGTVVVSNGAIDALFRDYHVLRVLGKEIQEPAIADQQLAQEMASKTLAADDFDVATGKTMCCYDFYEEQGRLDGPFCSFTAEDKMEFLKRASALGVKNIEMEAVAFFALTHKAQIKSSIVCVTFLDRLKGDQVEAPKETLLQWERNVFKVVARFIKDRLDRQ